MEKIERRPRWTAAGKIARRTETASAGNTLIVIFYLRPHCMHRIIIADCFDDFFARSSENILLQTAGVRGINQWSRANVFGPPTGRLIYYCEDETSVLIEIKTILRKISYDRSVTIRCGYISNWKKFHRITKNNRPRGFFRFRWTFFNSGDENHLWSDTDR